MGFGSVETNVSSLSVGPLEGFSSFDSQLFESFDALFAFGLAGARLIFMAEIGFVLTERFFGLSKSTLN